MAQNGILPDVFKPKTNISITQSIMRVTFYQELQIIKIKKTLVHMKIL